MTNNHPTHLRRTVAYLRWLRMNTHWWRYFNASSKNLLKYEHMRELLLSEHRWYRSFSYHWHYDVSLDEFYKFLEQVLDEFQIPHAILNDFRNYAREQRQKQRRFYFARTYIRPVHHTQNPLVLRI